MLARSCQLAHNLPLLSTEASGFGNALGSQMIASLPSRVRKTPPTEAPKGLKKMKREIETRRSRSPVVPGIEPFYSVGSMKVVRDRYGRLWLCSMDVDEEGDIEAQGGWRCGNLAFTCIG